MARAFCYSSFFVAAVGASTSTRWPWPRCCWPPGALARTAWPPPVVPVAGLVLFAAASRLACGLAPTWAILIAARAVQGLGAAAMFATTTALLFDPHVLGRSTGGSRSASGAR